FACSMLTFIRSRNESGTSGFMNPSFAILSSQLLLERRLFGRPPNAPQRELSTAHPFPAGEGRRAEATTRWKPRKISEVGPGICFASAATCVLLARGKEIATG